jgi:hypothetical protein
LARLSIATVFNDLADASLSPDNEQAMKGVS